MDLDSVEGYVANHLRLFISMVAALLIFVGIIAVSVFFVFVNGAEQTMVPNVQGLDLTSALMELQVKELYPRIQLRYSQSSVDKGLILEQDPVPGTIVKAGRRIRLVVSQGVLINTVENYLGRNIDEIRLDLQTLFASEGTLSPPLLTLKEPPMYEHSIEAPGTILQQKPEPGTGISGPTVLELVVSLGPEEALLRVPNFIGLDPEEALAMIGRSGIDFIFNLRTAQEGEKPGVVVSQVPAGDTMIAKDTRVRITMTESPANTNNVFGLFRYNLARNPYPLALRLEALLPSGERRRLLSTEYSGGELTVPYNLPLGTVLILYTVNIEIHRETVIQPAGAF
ncbi:MAG: PASTA domain-containing protein [Treponema sp.]|jgi:beta-lactam-binding protein with PASTA domain|nr:PASTA domain-containing protein [Treponema sp.]